MSIFILFFLVLFFAFSICIISIITIFKEEKENINLRRNNKLLKFIYLHYAETKNNFLL